jgi:hypothetical protein
VIKKEKEQYFSTFDIVKLLKIKRERLKNWIEQGFVKPYKQIETGPGKKSLFDIWHLYNVKLFEYLVDHGISRKEAAKWSQSRSPEMLKDLKGMRMEKPDFLIFKRKNGTITQVYYDYDVSNLRVDVTDDFDDIFILNFAKIRHQVDSAVKE